MAFFGEKCLSLKHRYVVYKDFCRLYVLNSHNIEVQRGQILAQNISHSDTTRKPKRWAILLPFGSEKSGVWIDDFGTRADLSFTKITSGDALGSWHKRGPTTPFSEWLFYLKHALRAVRMRPDGIITSFPQLAFTAAILLTLVGNRKTRLIAWTFNLGSVSQPWKGRIAGFILRRVDIFIVHSRAEEKIYSDWLKLPKHRFRFKPLQRGAPRKFKVSSTTPPYIVSMGSANRDYSTLVKAISDIDAPIIIISKESILAAIPDSPQITKMHDIPYVECLKILAAARLNIVPLKNVVTASGQISFLNAMRMGIPTIATKSAGTVDYIEDMKTGMLIEPNNIEAMREAIRKLWKDDVLHRTISTKAIEHAENYFSDEAAAKHLFDIIDEMACDHSK